MADETAELRRLRRRIDALDRRIVALLNERAELGRDVGREKVASLEVTALVTRLLAKDPVDRVQSARALATELDRCIEILGNRRGGWRRWLQG